jgi:hypothetical protein
MTFKKVFLVALVLSVAPVFFLLRYLEETNRSDSLGLWYTIYSTAILSIAVASIAGSFVWLSRTLRRLWS